MRLTRSVIDGSFICKMSPGRRQWPMEMRTFSHRGLGRPEASSLRVFGSSQTACEKKKICEVCILKAIRWKGVLFPINPVTAQCGFTQFKSLEIEVGSFRVKKSLDVLNLGFDLIFRVVRKWIAYGWISRDILCYVMLHLLHLPTVLTVISLCLLSDDSEPVDSMYDTEADLPGLAAGSGIGADSPEDDTEDGVINMSPLPSPTPSHPNNNNHHHLPAPPHLHHPPPPPPPPQQQQQQQQWPGLHHTQGGLAVRGARLHSWRHSHSQRTGAAGVLCARCRPGRVGQEPHRRRREVRSAQHAAPWGHGQRQLLWMGGRKQPGYRALFCIYLFFPFHFTMAVHQFWPLAFVCVTKPNVPLSFDI